MAPAPINAWGTSRARRIEMTSVSSLTRSLQSRGRSFVGHAAAEFASAAAWLPARGLALRERASDRLPRDGRPKRNAPPPTRAGDPDRTGEEPSPRRSPSREYRSTLCDAQAHFPCCGARAFSSSNQFVTRSICFGADLELSSRIMTKCCPSGEMSQAPPMGFKNSS